MNKKRKVTAKGVKQKTETRQRAAEKPKARLHYKDTIFRMIFNDRENF